jgi:hypothetical protein
MIGGFRKKQPVKPGSDLLPVEAKDGSAHPGQAFQLFGMVAKLV